MKNQLVSCLALGSIALWTQTASADCGGFVCDTLQSAKEAVRKPIEKGFNEAGNALADLEKTVRTGKCGGDICNEWERSVKPAGQKAGAAWDRAAKPVGQYVAQHPLESAIMAAAIAWGGYELVAGTSDLSLGIVAETSEGWQVVPIITVSHTTAGVIGLASGGVGILNAASQENQASQGVTDEQLRKAAQFREDLEKHEPANLAEDGELYERYFSTRKYGRHPQSSVFALQFPLEAVSPGHRSSRQEMTTVFLGAPIKDHGGDIVSTGDFMNLRDAGKDPPVPEADKRLHAAYDIAAQVNADVYAPMTGEVVAIALPYGNKEYGKSGRMLGLTIRAGNGVTSQIFYVKPTPAILNALKSRDTKALQVFAGETIIGHAQDVRTFYIEKGAKTPPQNHVHLQFLDDHGRSLELGGGKVVTAKGASGAP